MQGDPGDPVDSASHDPSRGGAGLARRFFVGGLYIGFGSWVTSTINFAIGLLLARLLGPEVFGFYALVVAVDQFLNMVGAFSMQLAIVQHPRESETLYDTALRISVLLGVVGLLLALAVAPILAHYRSTQAAWFLVVLGIARVATLVSQVPVAHLARKLRFRAIAIVGAVSGNLPNFCALGLAALGAGVWSLLAKDVISAATTLVLAFALSRYRFRGRIDRALASDLMAFGRPMFFSRASETIFDRLDRLLVGAWLGDIQLGLYSQARALAETPMIATRTLSPLTFNLYSRLRAEPHRLIRAYILLNYFLVRGVFAGAVVLLVYPAETIRLLLGADWIAAAPSLRWLALYAGVLPTFENMKQLLMARGLVWQTMILRLVQIALFVPGIVLGIAFDRTEWVAGALVFATLGGMALASYYSRDLVGAGLGRLVAVPLTAFAGAAVFFAVDPWNVRTVLPYWVLPFLPAVGYGLLLGLLERGRLLTELRYLLGVLRSGA